MKEYEVEKIVGKRTVNKGLQYHVKWKGWSEKNNTWEPVKNLNCPDLIAKFEESESKNVVNSEAVANGSPKTSSKKRSLSPAEQANTSNDTGSGKIKRKKRGSKKPSAKRTRLNSWHSDDVPLAKLSSSNRTPGNPDARNPAKQRTPIGKRTNKSLSISQTLTNDDEELDSSMIASKVTDVKKESGKIVYAVKFSGIGKPKYISSNRARTTCMSLVVDYYEKKFLEV